MSIESWKAVVGYEGLYEVSDQGRVRNSSGHVLQPWDNKYGRLFVHLCGSARRKAKVAHLVLEAFVGPRPSPRREACHFPNRDTHDNRLCNLRWDTRAGNFADKIAHGTHTRGERNVGCKLTRSEVSAIRRDARSQRVIAADYGVSQQLVSGIKRGERRAFG